MIPTTTNWRNAFSGSGLKQPVFAIAFSGPGAPATVYATAATGFTNWVAWAKPPKGLQQSVTDLQGKSSIGQFQFEVVDVGGGLLATFTSVQWYGLTAEILLGDRSLGVTDYIVAWTGTVQSVQPNKDFTSLIFNVVDKKRTLKSLVYNIGQDGINPTASDNPILVDGNPVDISLALLEDELGIASSDIDLAAWNGLKTGRLAATRMQFQITQPTDGLSFLENEICIPNGLFMFSRYDGSYSVHDMLAPPDTTPARTFTDSDITPVPQFKMNQVVDWVQANLDYDGNDYTQTFTYLNAAAIGKFGLTTLKQINSQGLRSRYQGASRGGITARRIFLRYGLPTARLSLVHPSLRGADLEVGDYLALTSAFIPNFTTGAKGVTNRVYEILGISSGWDKGNITFDLLDVNQMAVRKAYQFAPGTVPAWTSATAPQKAQYGFMSNLSDEQSDGSPAGEIY